MLATPDAEQVLDPAGGERANAQDGFAWTNGLESDPVPPNPIYETTNSGRSWHVSPRGGEPC
jgi:hypothetical protein